MAKDLSEGLEKKKHLVELKPNDFKLDEKSLNHLFISLSKF